MLTSDNNCRDGSSIDTSIGSESLPAVRRGDGLEKMPLHTTARFWLRLARGPLAAASAYATCSFTSCAAWPPTAPIQVKNTSVLEKAWRPGWQLALEYRIELGRELGSGGFGQVQQIFPSPPDAYSPSGSSGIPCDQHQNRHLTSCQTSPQG